MGSVQVAFQICKRFPLRADCWNWATGNDIEFAKRIGQFDTVNKEILGTSEKILEDIDSIQAIYAHSFDDAHFYQAQANLVGDLGHLANERNKQRQELEIEKTKSNIGRNRNFLDKFKFGHL